MAKIQPVIRIEIDPNKPVPEICEVIAAVLVYHPGKEELLLKGLAKAIDGHMTKLKGDGASDKQVREPGRSEQDQG